MTWRVVWTDPARHDLTRLDKSVARRIAEAIARLAQTGEGDVTRLRPPLKGYRLRVGDWRVTFDRDPGTATVTLRRIRHRREAYRDR